MEPLTVAVEPGIELAVHHRPGGDRLPFLLVHGLASSARLWDGVAAELEAAGHPVAAVDLRGHGRSAKPDHGYGFDRLVTDLAAVAAHLHWPRLVAVGQSWGANVVLELAARRLELVAGAALIDGGWIELSCRFPDWPRCRDALAPPPLTGLDSDAVERQLRRRHPDWPETGIQGALSCFEVRRDGTVAPWLTPERHLRILRHLWEHRPSRRYASVRPPVLLVPADEGGPHVDDKKLEVAAAEAGLSRSRTCWFTAGHDVHAQHPEEVAELLHGCTADGFFS